MLAAVLRLGYVSDDELRVLYRAARAHLLVSRCEGFGLTVVEAMAAGCPVVTTKGGSLSEVAGDAALQVDPENLAAIGDALVRLCREPELPPISCAADASGRRRFRAPRRLARWRAFTAISQNRGSRAPSRINARRAGSA